MDESLEMKLTLGCSEVESWKSHDNPSWIIWYFQDLLDSLWSMDPTNQLFTSESRISVTLYYVLILQTFPRTIHSKDILSTFLFTIVWIHVWLFYVVRLVYPWTLDTDMYKHPEMEWFHIRVSKFGIWHSFRLCSTGSELLLYYLMIKLNELTS